MPTIIILLNSFLYIYLFCVFAFFVKEIKHRCPCSPSISFFKPVWLFWNTLLPTHVSLILFVFICFFLLIRIIIQLNHLMHEHNYLLGSMHEDNDVAILSALNSNQNYLLTSHLFKFSDPQAIQEAKVLNYIQICVINQINLWKIMYQLIQSFLSLTNLFTPHRFRVSTNMVQLQLQIIDLFRSLNMHLRVDPHSLGNIVVKSGVW